MESMKELVSTSSDPMRNYTAAELGVKPRFCPVCGKEKVWRMTEICGVPFKGCMMCQCEIDLEKEEKKQEAARAKQERLNRVLAMSNLGERFRDASFDNFHQTPETASCWASFRKYAEDFSRETTEGICIYGRPGNGKSHLAAALVNAVIRRGYTAVFIEVPDLFARIKATYDGEGSEDRIMRSLASCDLLILDDAGAEKPTPWVQEKFYQIINARYKDRKPVVITTNTPDMAGLEDIIGFRAYDRVLEMCAPLKNNGESYRRNIAVQRLRREVK